MFWALVYLDPDFVMDEQAKELLSIRWFNHTLHTSPIFTMALDFIVWKHPRPSKSSALKALFIFSVLYMIE